MSQPRIAIALLTGLTLVLPSGCGSGSGTPPPQNAGPHINTPIELADCTDWNNANTEDRLGTLRMLKNFAGGPVVGTSGTAPSGTGAVLDDKQGYDLLSSYCKADLARGFKLYKLYDRASAIAGHPQQ
jgi:hypothetical protein